jgi:succinate-semialdehyde dehydrogenase / glutarate-semialdehyde dehydrogenase
MTYQTINPFTGNLIATFPIHTDAELEAIIAGAEAIYRSNCLRSV